MKSSYIKTYVGRVILPIAGAVAIGAGIGACAPPPQVKPGIPGLPPCPVPVSRIFETNKVPCLPVAPQRLDVVLAIANQFDPTETYAAGLRCGGWGGAVVWQNVNGANVQVCRTVDPYTYSGW